MVMNDASENNNRIIKAITTRDSIRLKPDRWAGRVGLAGAPFT
jgi:hypothetical protein